MNKKPKKPSQNRICVGIILGAHGIKGEVRLKSLTDVPENIMSYKNFETDPPHPKITIQSLRTKTQDVFLAQLHNIYDRTTAEQLKGVKLYIQRGQLPKTRPDEYYQADLEGFAVKGSHGQAIGTIRTFHNFGAGDLMEIQLLDRTTVMIPFVREACPDINLDEGYVTVNETILEVFQGKSDKPKKDP